MHRKELIILLQNRQFDIFETTAYIDFNYSWLILMLSHATKCCIKQDNMYYIQGISIHLQQEENVCS